MYFMNDKSGNITTDEYKKFFDCIKRISDTTTSDDEFEVVVADTKTE